MSTIVDVRSTFASSCIGVRLGYIVNMQRNKMSTSVDMRFGYIYRQTTKFWTPMECQGELGRRKILDAIRPYSSFSTLPSACEMGMQKLRELLVLLSSFHPSSSINF